MRAKSLLITFLIAASFARAAATEQKSPWISLFNGVSITGWKVAESAQTFTVSKGEIVAHGPRAHLFYVGPRGEHEWKDFELEMEVKTAKDANSGSTFTRDSKNPAFRSWVPSSDQQHEPLPQQDRQLVWRRRPLNDTGERRRLVQALGSGGGETHHHEGE